MLALKTAQGSPPHMRGKVLGAGEGCDGVGITPAHAGKRQSEQVEKQEKKDHPRTCGEKGTVGTVQPQVAGSPPHMRGKVDGCAQLWALDRITPAHAGKRNWTAEETERTGDHPRVCGEKF